MARSHEEVMKRYPPEPRPSGQPEHPGQPAPTRREPLAHSHHETDAASGAEGSGWAAAADGSQQLLAMLGYLGVIFFGFLPALVIYLVKGRSAPYLRHQTAQAVNLWVALILFDLCIVIVGAMLALDTVGVALTVVLPLATGLWLTGLAYIVRGALATARGEPYELPRWLRVDLLR